MRLKKKLKTLLLDTKHSFRYYRVGYSTLQSLLFFTTWFPSLIRWWHLVLPFLPSGIQLMGTRKAVFVSSLSGVAGHFVLNSIHHPTPKNHSPLPLITTSHPISPLSSCGRLDFSEALKLFNQRSSVPFTVYYQFCLRSLSVQWCMYEADVREGRGNTGHEWMNYWTHEKEL